MRLEDLGPRICILGPSGSGKSTLADRIGRATGTPVVHLDQLRHRPGTHWVLRPDEEFLRLHAASIAGDRWVIEGNYSAVLPERLARATGVLLLDVSTARSLVRYVRRTRRRSGRVGGLGVREHVTLAMVRWILLHTRRNRRRRLRWFAEVELPKAALLGPRAIRAFSEGIRPPS